jgi:hypothetical protein
MTAITRSSSIKVNAAREIRLENGILGTQNIFLNSPNRWECGRRPRPVKRRQPDAQNCFELCPPPILA